MKSSVYKSYDELPLFLNAKTVAKVLGVSPSSGYELMLVVAKSTPLHPAYMPGIRSAPLLLLSGPHPLRWAAPRLGGLTAAPIFAVFGTV